jgi:hypothetical protein
VFQDFQELLEFSKVHTDFEKPLREKYNKFENSPQIASNAQRVIFGKISKGVFDFCFARISTKVLLCLSKISTKSSNILKWKAGVITLRR